MVVPVTFNSRTTGATSPVKMYMVVSIYRKYLMGDLYKSISQNLDIKFLPLSF